MADRPRTNQEVYMLNQLNEKNKQRDGKQKTREELLVLLQIERKKNECLIKELETIKAGPMDYI